MTPRGRGDEPEFEEQFGDDVFREPAPAPKRRARTRTRASSKSAPPPSRARSVIRIVGLAALALALVVFVVSFIAGLGAAPDERVTGDARRGGERLDQIGTRIRVEVLNAGGVAGLARRATEHLRDRGFDVVAFGNAGVSGNERTVVLARTAEVEHAHAVAAALGVDSVSAEPDAQLFLDVTVLLGRDWPPVADTAAAGDTGFFGWFRSLF
jgi:hypothetical protein